MPARTDGAPHAQSVSPLVAAASAAYDDVMIRGLRAALDAHDGDRCAAAADAAVRMLPQAFARACRRYGIETTPGKAGRPRHTP